MYIGGELNAPEYLMDQMRDSCSSENASETCEAVSGYFQRAQECYQELSNELGNLNSTVLVSLQLFRLLITCNTSRETNYVVNVPASYISQVYFLTFQFQLCVVALD